MSFIVGDLLIRLNIASKSWEIGTVVTLFRRLELKSWHHEVILNLRVLNKDSVKANACEFTVKIFLPIMPVISSDNNDVTSP